LFKNKENTMLTTRLQAKKGIALSWLFAALSHSPHYQCLAADPNHPTNLPPGSLILRGPATAPHAANQPAAYPQENSGPEQFLGLRIEQAMLTNGYFLITEAFDLDVFYYRMTSTLPTADNVKQSIRDTPKNEIARKLLLKNITAGVKGEHIRFLGVRRFEGETELLLRAQDFGTPPTYTGYVTERLADGTVKLIDVHRFESGELLSQTMRRQTLLELARKRLLVGQPSATDQAFVSALDAWTLFTSRHDYGKFDLTKQAYDKLPLEVQNDRGALFLYTEAARSVRALMVPVERWRQQYPGDPCPDVMLIDLLWALYQGPRSVQGPSGHYVDLSSYWTAEEEAQAAEAIDRANLWLADPAQEVRIARYYAKDQPAKASSWLQKARTRSPLEKEMLDLTLSTSLAVQNFDEAARTLQLEEPTYNTNLSAMVDQTPTYAAFRKSLAWKKWQHDAHAADPKSLVPAPTPVQPAK